MGTVYRAEQKSLQRHVALKVFNQTGDATDPRALARFEREARIMAQLKHPDIVQIHDFGLHGEHFYLSMDLVEGMSLDRFCRSYAPSLAHRVQIVERLTRALQYAHDHGVIHRDVKPSNVLVDHDGNPKLSDFGLAKLEGSKLTQSFGILGTPNYMSPEQATGRTEAIDARTDIYSAGTVLYELITGQIPFSGTGVESLIHQVLHTEPVPPRRLDPSVPVDLETICLKAMAKDPSRRYPTALAFAEDLRSHLRHEPISARRPGIPRRLASWARRHKPIVTIMAVAVVGTSLGAGASFHFSSRLRKQEQMEQLFSEAKQLFAQREFEKALPLLERLRGTARDLPEVRLQRAICLCELRDRARAEEEFSSYLDQFPEDATAWRHRGLNALEQDDLEQAVTYYRQSAHLAGVGFADEAAENGDLDALVVLVERHFHSIDSLHALPHLYSYDPSYDFIHAPGVPPYELSSEWARRFPHDEARPPSKPLWSQADHPVILGWRAKEESGNPMRAVELLGKAIQAVPVSRWFRLSRLQALLKEGRLPEVKQDRKALEVLLPSHMEIHIALAEIFLGAGSPLLAAREFEILAAGVQAGRIKPISTKYGNLYLEAARCAARAGAPSEVLRLLRLIPEQSRASLSRARLEGMAEFEPVRQNSEFKSFLETLAP